jgi:PTH1 family peptidyl-tRNA hydrolase
MSIAVVAGLGNPGARYCHTRHNVGFAVADALAGAASLTWSAATRFEADTAAGVLGPGKVLLAKPRTFMNDSGRAIGAVLRYRGIEPDRLVVIHDDITLDPFRTKLSFGGGAGGHNGIADLIARLGPGFYRFRIGIGGRRHPGQDLADFVLEHFSEAERAEFARRLPSYLGQLRLLLEEGPEAAMNRINQRISTNND